MKKYFLTSLFIPIIVLLQLSCKKYLDEKSDDSLIVPSTLNNFQMLLDEGNVMNNATPSIGVSSADDYFLEQTSYNSKNEFQQHLYRWEPYPYYYNNDWGNSYKAIYSANLCLERLPLVARVDANAAQWDHIKGSALFYKAFYELELVWLFAKAYDETTAASDPGIVLREGTNFLVASVRSSVQDCYTKIISQAKEAAGLLDDEPLFVTRPCKPAAFSLLARTYLSMRMYDSAFKYADSALQIKSTLMNYNDASVVNVNGTNPFKIFNTEVIFHGTVSNAVTIYNPSNGPGRVDSMLFNTYHTNDTRRRAFFSPVSGFQRFKGSYSGSTTRVFSGIATDEVWLMRAECNARLGHKDASLADLNSVLQKRFAQVNFVPVTAATTNEALDKILLERRKELIFRGSLRWIDVKRLNKEGRNIIMKRKINNEIISLAPNDKRYALQIPQDIIETTGMEQNP
jgi:tetratricopeptide (TPR) repeat protein